MDLMSVFNVIIDERTFDERTFTINSLKKGNDV